MMCCTYVDELESQRRELEARRAMLEERFKLRLATAQEFGMIHTHRLGRVREAFVAQCGAARRRNQSILDKVKQSNDAFSQERALSGLSHKRLSHQTERFLSVADKLYPAWQEEQLHRKASQLATIEEERFVTEQRRRAARDRFEQEQALAAVVAEGQRRLAAARAHERNDSAVRQVRRDRSTAADGQALNAELERVKEAGRNARYDALLAGGNHNSARYDALAEEDANHRRRRRRRLRPRSSDRSSDSGSDDSGDGGEGAGRSGKRCYIGTDDDLDEGEGDERECSGGSEGGSCSIGKDRRGTGSAVRAPEGVGQARRDGEAPAGVRKERRGENEGGGADAHERSRVAEVSTRRGRGRGGVESLEHDVLQDVFCARREEGSQKAGRVADRVTGNPERRRRCGDDTAAEELGDNPSHEKERLQRRSSSSPLAVRNNDRHESGMTTTTATAKPDAERAGERKSKTRDSRRRHRRRRSDENELSAESPQSLPPPPPNRSDGGRDSGVDEGGVDSIHGGASAGGKPRYSTQENAELDLPRPPEKLSPPPGQRGERTRSFSSSDGSGRVMTVSSEETASKLRDGGGTIGSSRKGVREGLSREATVAGSRETGAVIAAARVPSWSEEEEEDTDDDDGGPEAENKKRESTAASAILSSQASGFDHAVTAVLGRKASRRDGRHGEPKVRRTPSTEGYLPPTLASPSRRPCLSLPAAARAVAALTAQIEKLAAILAAAPHGDEPGQSSSRSPSHRVLDAYGSVATVRSDGAKAAAAAAAAATPVNDTAASTPPPPELAAFEMADLCAAVLDLITAHSAEILPAEALSGIVTAAKVRAEHRRGGKAHPGRLQLFDAVTSHARRLASGKDVGGVDASTAAVAGVFAPCFEAAFSSSTARGSRSAGGGGASERLRRKVFTFLESAAGSNGAVDRGATAARKNHASSNSAPAMPVMAATGLTDNDSGSGGFAERTEGLPDERQPKG
ncbi:unnamed protein product, partial [Ectocarpus fasciculatus]